MTRLIAITLPFALAGWLQAGVVHVDPAHPAASDTNPGTEAQPFATLAPALAAAGPDVTVMLAAGAYQGGLDLAVGGTAGHPFTIASRVAGGAVFDLTGSPCGLRGTGAGYVVLEGLVLRNAAQGADRAALEPGHYWTVRRCRIEDCFAGILLNAARVTANGFTLEQSVIEDCRSFGLLARGDSWRNISGPAGLTVRQAVIRRCQSGGYGAGCYAAGLYARRCASVRVTDSACYDNGGPGIWLDDACNGFTLSNNTLRGNHSSPAELGSGIEICDTTSGTNTITSNLIGGNSGAGIVLAESRSITVTGNTLLHNGGGIMFRNLFLYNGAQSSFSMGA